MVGVQLAPRSFQRTNSSINRRLQQNNPRCSHQIQIQKPGERPANLREPDRIHAATQYASLHSRKRTTHSTTEPLRHKHAQKASKQQRADQRRLEAWREDSWDLLLGIHIGSSPRVEPPSGLACLPPRGLLLRRLRRADRAEVSIAGGGGSSRGDGIGNGGILRWAERRVI
jgi:hypothetical protein